MTVRRSPSPGTPLRDCTRTPACRGTATAAPLVRMLILRPVSLSTLQSRSMLQVSKFSSLFLTCYLDNAPDDLAEVGILGCEDSFDAELRQRDAIGLGDDSAHHERYVV